MFKHILLVASLLVMHQAAAQDAPDEARGNAPETTGETEEKVILSESEARVGRREAAELAREHYQGRVLNIRYEEGGWIIRMDNQGTVFNVRVDGGDSELTGPEQQERQ